MSDKSRNMESGEPCYNSSSQPNEHKKVDTKIEKKEEITLELRSIIASAFKNNHLTVHRELSPIIEIKKSFKPFKPKIK